MTYVVARRAGVPDEDQLMLLRPAGKGRRAASQKNRRQCYLPVPCESEVFEQIPYREAPQLRFPSFGLQLALEALQLIGIEILNASEYLRDTIAESVQAKLLGVPQ